MRKEPKRAPPPTPGDWLSHVLDHHEAIDQAFFDTKATTTDEAVPDLRAQKSRYTLWLFLPKFNRRP